MNDVGRLQRLTIVELNSLAQLKGPLGSICVGFPALRQLGHRFESGAYLGQSVQQLSLRIDLVGITPAKNPEQSVG